MKGTLTNEELASFLKAKADQYAKLSFIKDDPIQIPHQFSLSADVEISGFLAATLAWGQRKTIIAKSLDLIQRMDHQPFEFVTQSTEKDLNVFNGFVHRTFKDEDIKGLIRGLQSLYSDFGSMEAFFAEHSGNEEHLGNSIAAFKTYLLTNGLPFRSSKHLGDPSKGSASKRMVMYTRWMVRTKDEGIDFGLWKSIPSSKLSLPLDVHSARVARSLGLLKRTQNDWTAVRELDKAIRAIEPIDPARLDYALFGLGVYEGWK
jgi:uncharacterized protein (TIGR02757 family)